MPKQYRGLDLDPFQAESFAALERGQSVIVAAPTGSGKTLVAEYAIERALQAGERVVYTAPIKALSNQKFRDFSARWGADKVGILTGDVAIRPDAPCCIMTTEIFRNCIFEGDRLKDVRWCVFDEIHFIDDEERGTVWEESVIFAPPAIRFVCLSATVPNLDDLAGWMSKARGQEFAVVRSDKRPVPLEHRFFVPWGGGPLDLATLKRSAREWKPREPPPWKQRKGYGRARRRPARPAPPPRPDPTVAIDHARNAGRLPLLYFAFGRRACEELTRANSGRNLMRPDEEARAGAMFDALAARFGIAEQPGAMTMRRLIVGGTAYHHAGMLPTLKEVVEQLFAAGLVKILFATETFALGVNMPAASVAFDDISKFNGIDFRYLRVRDYQQMAGRAGRRGMDTKGTVFALTSGTPDDARACARMVTGTPEPIESRFHLSYATILNLLERLGERLPEVAERSFAAYLEEVGPGGMPAAELLRRRMEILREFHYIAGTALTPKGRFASHLFGYEMQVSELLWQRRLEGLEAPELAALFTSLVYEPRKGAWHELPHPEDMASFRRRFEPPIESVRRAEDHKRLPTLTKAPNFNLTSAAMAWTEGADFGQLRDHASLDPGDLVRTFRQALQVMRQTRQALPPEKTELKAQLKLAVAAMDRDEVDAEKQLNTQARTAPRPEAETPKPE